MRAVITNQAKNIENVTVFVTFTSTNETFDKAYVFRIEDSTTEIILNKIREEKLRYELLEQKAKEIEESLINVEV